MVIETPFGQLECRASAHVAGSFSVRVASVVPRLPSGHTVHGCFAMLWQITATAALGASDVTCEWVSPMEPGGGASGECLDALEWERGASAFVLGTEDAEALRARAGRTLPARFAASLDESTPIEYLATGLRVHLAPFVVGDLASGHFILAWTARSQAITAWLAADWSHAAVLAAVEGSAHTAC